jgi:hypothetical protein
MKREVPEDVEKYLIELYGNAGRLGGAVGTGREGAIGGGWGGKLGARLLRTKVERRSGEAPGTPEEVVARVLAAHEDTGRLPAEDGRTRLVVPVGLTGLQQIVVDLEFGAATEAGVHVQVTGYGKEGLINRSPTRKVTDRVWEAASAPS